MRRRRGSRRHAPAFALDEFGLQCLHLALFGEVSAPVVAA